MSPAHREEAVAAAIEDTFSQFDSITPDGKIDSEEFVAHLKGISFPSFPNSEPQTSSNDMDNYYTTDDPLAPYRNTADPSTTTTYKNYTNYTVYNTRDAMV